MARQKDSLKAKEIGDRITLARHEAGGMAQRELAELLGVTERSVAAYESGDVIPYRFMRQLESALGKPAAWFLYGEDAIRPTEDRLDEVMAKLDEILGYVKPRTRARR